MKSANSNKLVNLEQDLPTSREDILALRLARECRRLSFEDYLAFLASFPPVSMDELRARKGPAGDKSFEI